MYWTCHGYPCCKSFPSGIPSSAGDNVATSLRYQNFPPIIARKTCMSRMECYYFYTACGWGQSYPIEQPGEVFTASAGEDVFMWIRCLAKGGRPRETVGHLRIWTALLGFVSFSGRPSCQKEDTDRVFMAQQRTYRCGDVRLCEPRQ